MASEHVRPGEPGFNTPARPFELDGTEMPHAAMAMEAATDEARGASGDHQQRSRFAGVNAAACTVRTALEDTLLAHHPRSLRDALFQLAVVRDRLVGDMAGQEQARLQAASAAALDFVVAHLGFDPESAGMSDYLRPPATEGGAS